MSYDYKEGEYALSLGAYAQAFEIFIGIEREHPETSFIKSCQMVMADQASKENIQELEVELKKELGRNNGRAAYNYGLILAHLRRTEDAQMVLNQAMLLGISEAKAALTNLLLTGSVR